MGQFENKRNWGLEWRYCFHLMELAVLVSAREKLFALEEELSSEAEHEVG